MTLDEAILIAQRIEDDQVIGPVGMALRVLLKAYEEAQWYQWQWESGGSKATYDGSY